MLKFCLICGHSSCPKATGDDTRRYLSKAFFTVEVEEGDTPEGIQKCYDEMGIRLKYIDTKSEDGKDIFIYRHLS